MACLTFDHLLNRSAASQELVLSDILQPKSLFVNANSTARLRQICSMVRYILKNTIHRDFFETMDKKRRNNRLTRINRSDPIYFSDRDFIDERKTQIWH